jgi:hypothetical protein
MRKLAPFIVVAVLTGCAGAFQWNTARQTNTIEAYQSFLDRYPDSKYADEARSGIQTLMDSLRRIKRIHIVVEETYFKSWGATDAIDEIQTDPGLPFAALCRGLFEHAGVVVESHPEGEYEATLRVTVRGNPIYQSYRRDHAYSAVVDREGAHMGARLRGSIELTIRGSGISYRQDFDRQIDPPRSVESVPAKFVLDKAAFRKAFDEGFSYSLCALVESLYGAEVLRSAVKYPDTDVQKAARAYKKRTPSKARESGD